MHDWYNLLSTVLISGALVKVGTLIWSLEKGRVRMGHIAPRQESGELAAGAIFAFLAQIHLHAILTILHVSKAMESIEVYGYITISDAARTSAVTVTGRSMR